MKLKLMNDNVTAEQYKSIRNRMDLALHSNGYDYEDTIIDFLKLIGYQHVDGTSYTGDFGVDIIAYDQLDKIAIQCKRYSSNVNLKAVQEVYAGMKIYNCDIGMVITNSSYAKSAIELAAKCNIVLIDGNDLRQCLSALSQRVKYEDELPPQNTKEYVTISMYTNRLFRKIAYAFNSSTKTSIAPHIEDKTSLIIFTIIFIFIVYPIFTGAQITESYQDPVASFLLNLIITILSSLLLTSGVLVLRVIVHLCKTYEKKGI